MNKLRLLSIASLVAAVFGLSLATPAMAASGSGGGTSGGGTTKTSGGGSTSSDVPVDGEILVKLSSSNVLTGLLQKFPVTLQSRFGARPIYRLKVIGVARVKDVVAALSLEPGVMIAEANGTHRSPEARRNVPWFIGTQTAYATQWAPASMQLAAAQQLTQGAGVRVAVLDTGVDTTHPLLAGRLLPGFDFVDFDANPSEGGTSANAGWGHGTHVAGLIAMAAPAARIMPIRVLDADGVGNAWVLAEALLYAVDPDGNAATDDGAHVISLSLGSLSRTRLMGAISQIASCAPEVPGDPAGDRSDAGYDEDRARCAGGHGAVVVAAAGNDASAGVKEYPAAEGAYGLIAVTASAATQRLATFSNFGTWIDVAAPGEGITSLAPGGGYATWSGTSMAAPLVAGTAALVRSREPLLLPTDVVKRLKRTATGLCGTSLLQVNAAAAVLNLASTPITCR